MLTPTQAQSLLPLFAPDQVFTDPIQLITYEFDAGADFGTPDAVVLPHTAQEVQSLAGWASEHGIALTARGSGTGYTGGAVALEGGIVASLVRMNTILEIDEKSMQAIVQPGVISDDLIQRLGPLNLSYPPDPASLSVCSLGGTIAENAGGPHCLKYGVTGNYVLGLEVILADGRRLKLGGRAYDPPEYAFADLVIGSEGTLALITEAVLCLRRPAEGVKALTVAFAAMETAGSAVSAVIAAGLMPATIELMDGRLIAVVEDFLHAGLPTAADAMLIMDVDGYLDSLDSQLDGIVEVMRRFDPIEIKVARTDEERERLWLARRSAGPAVARSATGEQGIDVTVPRSRLAEAMVTMTQISERHGLRVTFLGHAGDGNLHPTWPCDPSNPEEMESVHQAAGEILRLCAGLGGSISGEHGVGIEKRNYLPAMYSPTEMGAMLEVKELFDPRRLLNPGKIFPPGFRPPAAKMSQPGPLPGPLFEPASAVEAAEGLYSLQAAGQPAFIVGGSTKWCGSAAHGTALSTAALTGIVDLATDDLYVTVMAGTPFDALQAELAEYGFWIPLTNPWPGATVGGMIASNANGPLRALYGGVRDYLLSLQVALPDGRLLRFGRPLVKDVAGYQMGKLFVGAYGSLALLTEVTFKLLPLPLARRSLLAAVACLAQGVDGAFAARSVAANCAGLVLVPGRVGDTFEGGWTLVFTAEGHPADVAAEMQRVRTALAAAGTKHLEETREVSAAGVWQHALAAGDWVVRAAVPPRDLQDYLIGLEPDVLSPPCVLDVPSGTLTVAKLSAGLAHAEGVLSGLRSGAETRGGYALIVRGPRLWLRQLDVWGTAREPAELMRGLKARWDPAGILNRGEFSAG